MRFEILIRLWLISMCFYGCNKQQNTSLNTKNRILRIALPVHPVSLDWHLSKSYYASLININIMRGLFKVDTTQPGFVVVPDLVKTLSHRNYKSWQICIDSNQKWSDGKAIKIDDFLASWRRLLDPKTGSPSAGHFFVVEGAEDFNQGKVNFSQVGFKKNNRDCVTIHLHSPYKDFPALLTAPYSFPIRADLIEKWGSKWLEPNNFVGLGDYAIASRSNQQSLTLVKRVQSQHSFHEIELLWIQKTKTARDLFRKKKLDLLLQPNSILLAEDLKKNLIEIPSPTLYFLAFNLKNKWAQNLQFRKTIANSVQREKLVKILGGSMVPTQSIVPWSPFEQNPTNAVHDDLSKTNGVHTTYRVDEEPVILYSNHTEKHRLVLEALRFQIEQHSKKNIQMKLVEKSDYFRSLVRGHPHPIFRLSWTPAVPTPMGYLDFFNPSKQSFMSVIKTKKLAQLFDDFKKITSEKGQRNHLIAIEQYLVKDQLLVVPLFFTSQSYLVNKNKIKFEPHFTLRILFSRIQPVNSSGF